MLELRILSGYHRGATLPLDGEALSIGADEAADVVLADPGLAAHHARLSLDGAGWVLEPAEGNVRDAHDNLTRERIALSDGDFARVGPIWLTVCDAGRTWQDPPPDPAGSAAPADTGATVLPAGTGPRNADVLADALADDPAPHAADAAQKRSTGFEEEASASPPAPGPRWSRRLRFILIPLTAAVVLSAAAAYAPTAKPDAAQSAVAAREAAARQRLAASPRRLPQAQLQAAFRKRLGDIDLLSRVTLDLREGRWEIQGALADEEAERLQRMLRGFSEHYVIDFPVNVRIGSAESMLPFRIQQVMSGTDPSIITDDGMRLYVGDEYRGVRLAAVGDRALRFTGKQNLDIPW